MENMQFKQRKFYKNKIKETVKKIEDVDTLKSIHSFIEGMLTAKKAAEEIQDLQREK